MNKQKLFKKAKLIQKLVPLISYSCAFQSLLLAYHSHQTENIYSNY